MPTVRARAASLELVATIWEARDELRMTVTLIADGTSTTVELPEALRAESYEPYELRVDKAGVELVHIGSEAHPGGLARWSVGGGWSKLVEFPAATRKAMGAGPIMAAPVADRWLLLPPSRLGVSWWTIGSTGVRRVPPPSRADTDRWHELRRSVEFPGGTLLLVGDGSIPSDKRTFGGPGRTRGVSVTTNRVVELGAPFPLPNSRTMIRAADGPAAAVVQSSDGPAKLVLVDATGPVGELEVPDGLPVELRWMNRTLVAWGAMGSRPGETKDHTRPLFAPDMSGWTVDMRTKAPLALHPFAHPAGAPPGWEAAARARIGNELCAWGGISTRWDDAAHRTLGEIEGTRRGVLGGACVDPNTATVRLLAAEPPPGYCRVLADGAQALIECTRSDVWKSAGGNSTLWVVTADRPPAGP